jgi:glycine dehydrogenase
MIEPTESEDKSELDRFIEAMIAIRQEIDKVEKKQWPLEDNPLVNSPHTMEMVTSTEWKHPYSREVAALPLAWVKANKFWPSVGRVDNAYGDRNVVCACPPLEDYQ